MATYKVCDLCASKAKRELCSLQLNGNIMAFKGEMPPAPPGFKYQMPEDSNKYGKVTYQKVWDNLGKVIKETRFFEVPKRYKGISINYDLCELCTEKFIALLESIKRKYHLEDTEIKMIEDQSSWYNPFLGLLGHDPMDDE